MSAYSASDSGGDRNLIVLIHNGEANDLAIAKLLTATFAKLGFETDDVSVTDPNLERRLYALFTSRAADIFCFFSFNYVAVTLLMNGMPLHTATGIPLVFFLMDHPLFFHDVQSAEYDDAIVFLPGSDVSDYIAKYYPSRSTVVAFQGFFEAPYPRRAPLFEDFLGRANVILCPLNLALWGENLDSIWRRIKALPTGRRDILIRIIDAALTDCFTPLHVIAAGLRPETRSNPESTIDDDKYALHFIKLWRRNRLIRSLIDLPILVSSNYVPADLEFAYPDKFVNLTTDETFDLYRTFRFVLNSFPLMTETIHDRMVHSMYNGCVMVTDQNNWTRRHLRDEVHALFFDYLGDDNVEKLGRYLDDPAAAFALTENSSRLLGSSSTFNIDSFADLIRALRDRRSTRA